MTEESWLEIETEIVNDLPDLLYEALVAIEKQNYADAKSKIWIAWGMAQRYKLSQSDRLLTDKGQ